MKNAMRKLQTYFAVAVLIYQAFQLIKSITRDA